MRCRPFLFVFLLTLLTSPFAYSHTFGIGVRAGDSGGVEVWYRSWHGCDEFVTEGEIKIEGVNGTTYGPISAVASLSSCDMAGGTSTFPVFEATNIGYYCEVNSSAQILNSGGSVNSTAQASLGTDPANPASLSDMGESSFEQSSAVGAILCNEDLYAKGAPNNMWQGSSYLNLAAGTYEITYVPCDADGDVSDCYDGSSASVTWDPDRQLVLSATVEISAELAAAAAAAGAPAPAATAVPTLPLFGLLTLGGLLGLFGLRKLKK